MKGYNKFMVYLWLVIAIVLTVFITFKSISEGFNRWGAMYVFAVLAFIIYLLRRFMTKRVEKHLKSMEEQGKKNP